MKSFKQIDMHMKKLLALVIIAFSLAACHKDLGDYEINMPIAPEVTNLDSAYSAVVGDSLIINPGVKGSANADLELTWRISVMTGNDVNFVGPVLKIIFGLQAERYSALLTVHNKTNGMKYYHKFNIQGATEFATGTSVLSLENGTTQFSFIKPDGTLQARLYKALHGKDLPANPLNLFLMKNRNTGGTVLGYFIISKNGGVRLQANTMMEDEKYPSTLKDNFFTTPDDLEVGSLILHHQGVMMGTVNGKFYGGTTSTWDQAPTYGMFGLPAEGEYDLAPSFVMAETGPGTYFVVFDKNKKQFQRINLYGSPAYFGNQYSVSSTGIFDPMNVGMELIQLIQINNSDCFAYMKNTDGKIYELKFTVQFTGPFTFTPQHKREFIRQDLIAADTKWQAAKNGLVYIASAGKVVRYNPINQEVRELATSFGGKAITMLKLSEDESTLMVGNEGTIWFTNITTGENGSFIKKIEGIPGSPVDMTIRQ